MWGQWGMFGVRDKRCQEMEMVVIKLGCNRTRNLESEEKVA